MNENTTLRAATERRLRAADPPHLRPVRRESAVAAVRDVRAERKRREARFAHLKRTYD